MAGINELLQSGPFKLKHGQCRTQGVWQRETDYAPALSVSYPSELCSRDHDQSPRRLSENSLLGQLEQGADLL